MPRAPRFVLTLLLAAACGLGSGCAALLTTLHGPPPLLAPAPSVAALTSYQVLRGAVHCHCAPRSHDATGSLQRIASAARRCGLSFVALTDHSRRGEGQLRGQTPRSIDGVVFLPGLELPGGGGSVLGLDLPRGFEPPARRGLADETLAAVRGAGGLALIGHAEDYTAWEAGEFDLLEVANLHAMAKRAHPLGTLGSALFLPPGAFFRRLTRRHDPEVFARWDALTRTRRLPAVGGCDAHESIRLFGALGGRLGSYEECFRALCTVVLARERSPEAVREALAEGRSYVACELSGASEGFRFLACEEGGAVVAELGQERPWRPGLELRVACPGDAELRLLRDGVQIASGSASLRVPAEAPGVYRVEAWLDEAPFVWSNPIYLR